MTKDDIIKLAQSAGLCDELGGIEGDSSCFYDYGDEIVAFARACFAIEREACAKVCMQLETAIDGGGNHYFRPADARQCVAAIRARSHDVS